jgi:hypothetical protein
MMSLFPTGAWAAHNEDMMRAAHLVAVAAIMAASCTASAPSAATPRTKSSPGSSPGRLAAGAPCRVTRPISHASPPAQMAAIPPLPVPYIHGWYGNSALWVGVPTGGVLPAQRDYQWPREWGTKFPWWRAIPGKLTITARRLDGPSAGFHGEVPDGYGRFGFVPSDLVWPKPGCWQVTGTIAGRSLTFVTRVKLGPVTAG